MLDFIDIAATPTSSYRFILPPVVPTNTNSYVMFIYYEQCQYLPDRKQKNMFIPNTGLWITLFFTDTLDFCCFASLQIIYFFLSNDHMVSSNNLKTVSLNIQVIDNSITLVSINCMNALEQILFDKMNKDIFQKNKYMIIKNKSSSKKYNYLSIMLMLAINILL